MPTVPHMPDDSATRILHAKADSEKIAELRQQIERQARARFGAVAPPAVSEMGFPKLRIQSPSAAFWLETRRRICAAFQEENATPPPPGLRARLRLKLRGGMAWVRARVKSMEQRATANSVRGRLIAFARWLRRSLRRSGSVAPPMGPLAALSAPCPPAQSAMLNLVAALQRRDQTLEAEQYRRTSQAPNTTSKAA